MLCAYESTCLVAASCWGGRRERRGLLELDDDVAHPAVDASPEPPSAEREALLLDRRIGDADTRKDERQLGVEGCGDRRLVRSDRRGLHEGPRRFFEGLPERGMIQSVLAEIFFEILRHVRPLLIRTAYPGCPCCPLPPTLEGERAPAWVRQFRDRVGRGRVARCRRVREHERRICGRVSRDRPVAGRGGAPRIRGSSRRVIAPCRRSR